MSFCCSALMEVQDVPALPPVLFQVLCEAEAQTYGTEQGQACTCTLLSFEPGKGHQPERDSDTQDEHLCKKFFNVSAEGAVET